MTTKARGSKKPTRPVPPAPIGWPRADPAALDKFDPATKTCTMNCGPHPSLLDYRQVGHLANLKPWRVWTLKNISVFGGSKEVGRWR
ncbi:hypothetical protein ALP79_200364 [Pseudomonas savastanoi pv. fraxini]|nr:hypothetical protein ALP79_200364 [Pseudomonas savastanoi pv. fraxini]